MLKIAKFWRETAGFLQLSEWNENSQYVLYLFLILVLFTVCFYEFLLWRYLNSSVTSFSSDILQIRMIWRVVWRWYYRWKNQEIPMVMQLNNQTSSNSVRFLTHVAMVRVQTHHEARFMAQLIYCLGMCLWDSVLEAVPIGYGRDSNRLMIRERAEWVVFHFDRKSSSGLLPAIINFLSLSDESFSPKEFGCIYRFGKFTSVWNCVCWQYCTLPPVLCCIILHCNSSIIS